MRLRFFHAIAFFVIFPFCCGAATGMQVYDFKAFAEKVEKQTGYCVAYSDDDVILDKTEFPDISGLNAEQALRKVLDEKSYHLIFAGNHVIIRKNTEQEEKEEAARAEAAAKAEALYQETLALMVTERIPPRQSVFSSGTRLIIVRDWAREDASSSTVTAPATQTDYQYPETYRYERIPFRSDLLPVQAYIQPKDQPAGRKSRK